MSTRSRYSNFGDVDEYLMALDESKRSSLWQLREAIRKAVPQALEMMRYNMPYYEYKGMLCAFTAQENYLSLYILDDEQIEKYQRELPGLNISKGCIRFHDYAEFPEGVIERILAEAVTTNELRASQPQ